MNSAIDLPLDPVTFLKFCTVALFGLIIFIAFLYGTVPAWILKNRNNKAFHANELHKEPTKIIGGLAVFIVAIIANNPYIYFASLFIGGLLIASEKFMIHLAAIFNSNKDKVAEISKLWVEDLGNDEIKQKQLSEADEVISSTELNLKSNITKKGISSKKEVENQHQLLVSKIRNIEVAAMQKIESRLITNSTVLKPYVRIRANARDFQFDAIGQDLLTKKVAFGVDIKYYSYLHLRSIERLIERIKPFAESSSFPIIIVVVYDQIQKELLNNVENILPKEPLHNTKIGVVYYKVKQNGTLETVNDARLAELLPGEFVPF